MKSDQASASIMFSSTLATFIGFASAYVFSVPVSNNFELNRVYLYMLLVPGIVAALITGFLSKIVGTRIMALVTITVTSILLIACTIAASYFETTNTANYMVSIGHFLTHFPVLFMAFFAALLSSLTASFSHLLGNLSSHAGDSAYLMRAGLVNLLVALVIATCVAGIFMLYGFTWFLFLITLVEAVGLSIASIISVVSDNEKDVQPETPHVNHQEIQENTTSQPEALPERPGMNLATRVLLFFAMLCSGIMAGWMFPIASVVHDTTEFPPTSTYFVIKRTLVLEASLYTMVFGIGFILLILTIFKIKDITSASRRPASRASSITASQLGIFLSIAIIASLFIQYIAFGFVPAMMPFYPSWLGIAAWMVLETARFFVTITTRSRKNTRHVSIGIAVATIPILSLLGTIVSWEGEGSYGYFTFFAAMIAGAVSLNILAVVSCFVKGKGNVQRRLSRLSITAIEVKLVSSTKASKRFWIFGLVAGILLVSMNAGITGSTIAISHQRQVISELEGRGIVYLVSPNDRVDPSFLPTMPLANVSNVVSIEAAANEYEPVQLVFRATRSSQFIVYGVDFPDLVDISNSSNKIFASNQKAFWIDAIEELSMKWYDRIVPFMQRTVTMSRNEPLWLLFHVPAGTRAGMYNGTVNITISHAIASDEIPTKEIITVEINLRVFGFSLPAKPSLRSSYSFGAWTFDPIFGSWTISYAREHRMMAVYAGSVSITAMNLTAHTLTIDFTEFDARVSMMMGNQCLTNTVGWSDGWLPGGEFNVDGVNYTISTFKYTLHYNATVIEYFRQLEAHLKSKPIAGSTETWFDHAIIYEFDEVQGSRINDALRYYMLLKTNHINITIFQTWHKGSIEEQGVLFDYVDVWCIHLKAGSGAGEEPFVTAIRERGKPIWIYTTTGPRFPVPTLSLNNQGTSNRGLFWLCWTTNLSGYLIWSVVFFDHQNDGLAYQGWGGGMTMYLRDDGGLDGSHRNEMIREGNEDYEYFTKLKWILDNKVSLGLSSSEEDDANMLLERIQRLVPSHAELDFDTASFYALRHEIGSFIERALV